ncbi:unnamed protein product [Anisakis simplex]|uniref:KH domain-containing protein n=1 Tax=Anisakis simplex TaxID=6269 RepID=A0A0M3J2L5_ANISI|nr:unnamed protein product [Anisakis simplex]
MPTFTSGAFEEQNEAVRYLDELVRDMRKLNAIQRTSPLLFLHARYLLTTEMDRIWTVIYRRNLYQLSPSYLTPQNYYPSRHYMSEDEMITLQEKVEIPQKTGYNYICRILGPRGKTVRRLEAETGCHILIRGEGSLKNRRRELRLKKYAGWEHLTEPLHVLVIAFDKDLRNCELKLNSGIAAVSALINPTIASKAPKQLLHLSNIKPVVSSRDDPEEDSC